MLADNPSLSKHMDWQLDQIASLAFGLQHISSDPDNPSKPVVDGVPDAEHVAMAAQLWGQLTLASCVDDGVNAIERFRLTYAAPDGGIIP